MNNNKQIFDAIKQQKIQDLKKIDPDPETICGPNQKKLIHKVTQESNQEIFRYFVEKCKNLEIKDSIGRTPLHYAAISGQIDQMALLIQLGANIESQTIGGDTPLMKCALNNQKICYKFLIEKGANPHQQNKLGQSPEQIIQKY